ncbi:hypothetical protein [Mesorhizobium delmotii]|uniref:Uncharacterized protein n=1 Tax=Mesorhizobium delmotii TaxID=1631247 RepID=A0A2P9AAE6_9HYPH|nr:hypothetical protein [Mesorhizobium delmotii]SJM28077.1 hypothetical protein BQ8482_110007 [Mesorhizobium delmotii]
MTLRFVLSKMLQIFQMLWDVDTAAQPVRRGGNGFARATVRPIYSRNGIRVAASPRKIRDRK